MWINAENIINKFSLCVGFTTRPDMMRAIQIIKDEPGIDIVRCKECKFYDKLPTWSACTYWSGDPYEQASVNDNDFCSYGEREGE